MHKFLAILSDTVLEIRDRKIIYVFIAITIIMILVFGILPGAININGQNVLQKEMLDPDMVAEFLSRFFDGFFGFFIFLIVFGSAGLIPAYLRKGRVELNLSKPLSRMKLITYKYISVFLTMIAIMIISLSLVWLTICLRGGIFYGYYWYGAMLLTVQLLMVYGIIFFFGVLSNSTVAAIMGYFVLRIGSDLLSGREIIYPLLGDSVWKTILDSAYNVLPKFGEFSKNYISLMTGKGLGDTFALWTTFLFSAILFLLALIYFNRKDY
jgi:ABC-type transport system involved in multi-copper enzyme maturation permease subunit